MNYTEKASANFLAGYNCAQAVALAYAENFGISEQEASRTAAGFGGGMGGLREQCGAVSAMVYIAGLAHGGYDPSDNIAKKELYDKVKQMISQFNEKYGTSCCRDLLAQAGLIAASDPSERNTEYYKKRPCLRFVEAAAEIIEKNIINIGINKKLL